MMFVYMKVTNDKYELPEAIADSIIELAQMLGVKTQSIYDSMKHVKSSGSRSPYVKVDIGKEQEHEEDI